MGGERPLTTEGIERKLTTILAADVVGCSGMMAADEEAALRTLKANRAVIDLGLDVAFDAYDYLALVPVIEGTGGVITDWRGEPLTLASGDRILAAGDPARHAEALAILARP